jgi:hypothetical protein
MVMPTACDRSWQGYPEGAPGEAMVFYESFQNMQDRMELWSCEGTEMYPHELTINKTRRSRCRICGFDRRHLIIDPERIVMG